MIPIYDIKLSNQEKKNVNLCLASNWISSQGEFIQKFEKEIAKFHSMKYCLATSSCTAALHLAIKSLNLKKNDEIICPALTFISPANMILLSSCKLVLADIDENTLTINIKDLKKKISKRTKAIIVVHQFGHSAKMDEILSITKKRNIRVIEDNAESLGGRFDGKLNGTFGDLTTLSFFGNKILTTGEGGAIITNKKNLYERCLLMREHGMKKDNKYHHLTLGYNYRMTNMQAAIGFGQMKRIKKILQIRNNQIGLYRKYLKDISEIDLREFSEWCTPVHWLTTIHLKDPKNKKNLMNYLKKFNIETRPMIFPVNHAKHIKKLYPKKFENSYNVSRKSLHLPSGISLTQKNIIYISNKIKNFFYNRKKN